ncbi:LamG-like jellyroll fold domain-containing protein [Methylobacter svalbardensis]|uniref:LamG-like jellyroll fold domain-containing protein n=1 Tax=Methylobacter svalbardensis TaxID=3080016 RepID=UPI0030EBC919
MKNHLTNISLRELFTHFLLAGLALFLFSGNLFAASANLAWDASTSSSLGGYKVSYGTSSGNYATTIDAGNKTTYAVSGLQEGTKYYFAVKAYDSTKATESVYSNETNLTVPVTAATTALTADFTASKTSGVATLAVDFTPVTTGTVTSWTWSFPGSYTPTVTNTTAKVTTASYPTAGTYNVSLTATGSSGSVTKSYPNLITVTAPTTTTTSTGTTTTPTSTTTTPPATATSNNGLVAAYGFEETSGTTATDASGNSNHGTITNAVSIANGHSGKALSFNGTNAWVTVKDSASLDLSASMTLEAWVYPLAMTNGGQTVILKESSGAEVYALYADEDANLPVSYINNGSYRGVTGPNRLPVNTWAHLVSTYDGQYQRLYVNGIEVANSAQSGLIQQSGGVLRLGGNSVWGEYFNGYIDEVRIYNRALTATEVGNNLATPVSGASTSSATLQFILGNKNLEPWVDYRAKGVAQAFRAVPAKSGSVTEVKVYLDASATTATKLVAGIYTDNNAHPGTLVAKGALNTLKPGAWNSVTISAASVTAGKPYWLAILGPDGQVGFLDQVGSGTSVMERTSNSSTLTSLPATWAGSSYGYQTNASMSVYGNGI